MFKSIVFFILSLLCGSSFAQTFYDTARVISSQPLNQQVQRQYCNQNAQSNTQQQNSQRNSNAGAGAVIGGIAGALIGNTVGQGNGKVAATALGGIVGAMSGDRMEQQSNNNGSYGTFGGNGYGTFSGNTNQQCTTRLENVQVGFLVTYEYMGRQMQTQLQYDPGQTIRIAISIQAQ